MPPDPLEACVLWALAWPGVPIPPNRLRFPYDLLPKNILRRLSDPNDDPENDVVF